VIFLAGSSVLLATDREEEDRAVFTKSNDVKDLENGGITIGMVIINLKSSNMSAHIKSDLDTLVDNILHFSTGEPLRFLVITDEKSIAEVSKNLVNSVTKFYSMEVIMKRPIKKPRQRISSEVDFVFVRIDDIIAGNEASVGVMRSFMDKDTNSKYHHDLFYIGPFYATAFSQLNKFIFLDLDLTFYTSIANLWNIFSKFSKAECLGLAPDLSPHYYGRLKDWRQSHAGDPGQIQPGDPGPLTQGFNTGVALYDLECLRSSKVYLEQIKPEKVSEILKKYKLDITLGDQDWFTLLGFEVPSLFYSLPCEYNMQRSVQYLNSEYSNVFYKYSYCNALHKARILHRNGCGPKVEHCIQKKKELPR